MVTRNWKAIVSIGGTVAASLPNSAKRATQELDRLSGAQRIDQREARKLGGEIKTLGKGTQDYKTALAQQASVKTRLAERSVRIRELGERAQTSTGLLGRLSGGLARVGPIGAAAAAGVGLATVAITGLAKIANKYAGEVIGLSGLSLALNIDPELLHRQSAGLRTVTTDLKAAEQQAAKVASVGQQARLAQRGLADGFGAITLGASRAGVAIDSIKSGDYRPIVDDIRRSIEQGLGKDKIVAGLGQVGYDPATIQSFLLLATDVDAARLALENFNDVDPPSQAELRKYLEYADSMGDLNTEAHQLGRTFSGELTQGLTSVARSLVGVESLTRAAGAAVGRQVEKIGVALATLGLGGEYAAATWAVSSAGIRVGWYGVGETISGVTDDILAKLETLVEGFVSVADSVKTATGGVVDFTGTSASALDSIRDLRSGVQDSNAAAEAGLTAAQRDLRKANRRLGAVYQAEQDLKRGRQPTPAGALLPGSAELPAVQPQAAQPAVRPETALQPVAVPQPAVRPETALQPVAVPQPVASAGPGAIEVNATYYIDGATDVDAVLAVSERSTLRLVRQLA